MSKKYRVSPAAEELSGARRVIDHIWSDANEGLVWKAGGIDFNLSSGSSDEILFRTPSAPSIIQLLGLQVLAEGNPWEIGLFEEPIVSDPGTLVYDSGRNINRRVDNPNDHLLGISVDPTISNAGDVLDEILAGGITGQGNQSGSLDGGLAFEGWLLKQDTYYMMKITNNSGSTGIIALELWWREDEE